MFVWIFHRISGLLLIVLLLFQFCTGFLQTSATQPGILKTATDLHRQATLNCLLVFLVIFHGLYGLRTIVLDLGLKRERLLFWSCTVLGTAGFAAFLIFYFTPIVR